MRLPTRIVMPAMATTYPSETGGVTPWMLGDYKARAQGGTGLILVENCTMIVRDVLTAEDRVRQSRARRQAFRAVRGTRDLVPGVGPENDEGQPQIAESVSIRRGDGARFNVLVALEKCSRVA